MNRPMLLFVEWLFRAWLRLFRAGAPHMSAAAAADPAKKKVLIFSPNIGGHRLLYAIQFAEGLKQRGCTVELAYCGLLVGELAAAYRKLEAERVRTALEKAAIVPVTLDPTDVESGRQFRALCGLVEHRRPDYVFLMDGDRAGEILVRLALAPWRRIPAFVSGYFILTDFRDDYFQGGWSRFREAAYYTVLIRYLPQLQRVLYSDERIVADAMARCPGASGRFVHLLEPGMPAHAGCEDSARTLERWVIALTTDFLAGVRPEDIVFLWGDLENRKGYDWILRLAAEVPEIRVLRIGRTKPGFLLRWPDIAHKEVLYRSGRILEVDSFMPPYFFGEVISRVRFMFMPYHKFFRTSAVMHDICLRGLPVVVPDDGLLAHRVRSYGLGRCYEAAHYESFKQEALKLRSEMTENPDCYREALRAYAERFGPTHLGQACDAIMGREEGAS